MANTLMNRNQGNQNQSNAQPYLTLRDAMDRLFQDSFVWPRAFMCGDMFSSFGGQGLDLYETQDDVVVKAALPGIKPENVNIQVQGDQLLIDATMPEEKQENQNATYYVRGLTTGEYHRQITLPVDIDPNKVDATFDNGVLTIRLPKSEQVKPKKIQIKSANK